MTDTIEIQIPVVGFSMDLQGVVHGLFGTFDAVLPVIPSNSDATAPGSTFVHDGDMWGDWQVDKKPVLLDSLSVRIGDGVVAGADMVRNPICSIPRPFPVGDSFALVEGDLRSHPSLGDAFERTRAVAEDMAVVDGRIVLRNDGPLYFLTRIQDRRVGHRLLGEERMNGWDRRNGTTFSAYDYAAVNRIFHNYRVEGVTGHLPGPKPEGWDFARARSRIASRMLREIGKRLAANLVPLQLSVLDRDALAGLQALRNGVEGPKLLDSVRAMLKGIPVELDARSLLPGSLRFIEDNVKLLDPEVERHVEDLAQFRM